MAPTEESILSNFLLSPAPLPTVLSLQKFTELFPKRLRGHPHIRTLYRELQQVREHDMDRVNENIDQETQQGERQKAELRKASLAAGVEGSNADEQREMDVDLHLFGQNSTDRELFHSTASLLDEMEAACANIEREIGDVDREAAGLLSELQSTVGDLSDLRYGKLQGLAGMESNIGEEAIRGLENLENACYGANPSSLPASNPLPQLLQTPSGLAILELQATINLPTFESDDDNQYASPDSPLNSNGTTFETPVGKLMFPDYSPLNPDDTKWMKRVYLYIGRYQRMTGEVKKLPKPLAVLRKRSSSANTEELEVVEIVRYKVFFKNRPEPVNNI
ncbi:unnamed protein product [Penicillium pancosmium]